MRRVNLTAVLQETKRSSTSVNKRRKKHITVIILKRESPSSGLSYVKRGQLDAVRTTILEQNPKGYASTWVYYLGHI